MGVHVSSGVTIVLLAVGLVAASDRRQVEQRKALRHGQLSGFVYSDSWLFQHDMVSRIRCAGLCLLDNSCRTFTFTAIAARRGVCRGHSALMTSQNTRTTSNETTLYIMQQDSTTVWLYMPCNDSAACGHENSTCFHGYCSCIPGYYYSVSRNLCVDFCNVTDLQDSFQVYPGWRLAGHNDLGSLVKGSVEDCQITCIQRSTCRTVEWRRSANMCNMASVTALDFPSDWRKGSQINFDFYQRDCF